MLSKHDTLESAISGGYSLVYSCEVNSTVAQCTCFVRVLRGTLGVHAYVAVGEVLHKLAKVVQALQTVSLDSDEGAFLGQSFLHVGLANFFVHPEDYSIRTRCTLITCL